MTLLISSNRGSFDRELDSRSHCAREERKRGNHSLPKDGVQSEGNDQDTSAQEVVFEGQCYPAHAASLLYHQFTCSLSNDEDIRVCTVCSKVRPDRVCEELNMNSSLHAQEIV